MNILTIENLSKSFGDNLVIDQMSFSVPKGSIFGFIGKNGSGKTTTMKMILGLLKPSRGTIEVCGERVKYGQTDTNRFIGYLPDVPEFYNYMTAYEYLKLCGEITGLSRKTIKDRSIELLGLVGLDHNNKRIGTFSRGMKQRLGIAQALLHEPKLLICDEPTSALDPIGRKEILDILATVRGKTTVIFSTHILSDVERICDHIGILHHGKIILSGTMQEIKKYYHQDSCLIEFSNSHDRDRFLQATTIENLESSTTTDRVCVILKSQALKRMMQETMSEMIRLDIVPVKLEILDPTLENLFLEVVK